jgi:hypothetical protein
VHTIVSKTPVDFFCKSLGIANVLNTTKSTYKCWQWFVSRGLLNMPKYFKCIIFKV